MGIREIKWNKRATDRFIDILRWYQEECGPLFAQKFYSGILNTVELLAKMPTVGRLDERRSTPKTKYYSFLSHPKYRIVYRYTKTRLYIVAVHATMMKQA